MENTFIKLEDMDGNIISKSIEGLIGKKIAIHCDTEEKANEFLKKLDAVGVRWGDGSRTIDSNEYSAYGKDTCYDIDNIEGKKDELTYSYTQCYLDVEYEIYRYKLDNTLKVWELEEDKGYLETTTHDADIIFKMNRFGELLSTIESEREWRDETCHSYLGKILAYEFTPKKTELEAKLDGLLCEYSKEDILKVLANDKR